MRNLKCRDKISTKNQARLSFLGQSQVLLLLLFWGPMVIGQTAPEILQKTIASIDTIETLHYKQKMFRSNPQNLNDTIRRHREMYFKRLATDSIVGVKGHWYMYVHDTIHVIYEDIYDGQRLLRVNHKDKMVRIFDLQKYPAFRQKHFWSHNTWYGMQFEFKYMLRHQELYTIKRRPDTTVNGRECYVVSVVLQDKMGMPGFALQLQDQAGRVSENRYFIDKEGLYPIRVQGQFYSKGSLEQIVFIDQTYVDIHLNPILDENTRFNTETTDLYGYEAIEMRPE
ncbi:hypothetical protein [Sediminicola luteus]|uniref:Outer membrane lipoprotein-sorting protein n=1 Tax=Sediminicola luteus TaxID=319238 RepID=A0A2A4GD24_9FLAO|nr:hypothetical protein [Sediminicola luteus]PCE66321.1 hypothetical protein B7P33_03215 [Sediminicola luteus]